MGSVCFLPTSELNYILMQAYYSMPVNAIIFILHEEAIRQQQLKILCLRKLNFKTKKNKEDFKPRKLLLCGLLCS